MSTARVSIQHLRESGLAETVPLDGCGREAVVLTKAGRDFLESHRLERGREARQAFYAALRKPRESRTILLMASLASPSATVYALIGKRSASVRHGKQRRRTSGKSLAMRRVGSRRLQSNGLCRGWAMGESL